MSEPRFCARCGTAWPEGSRFCGRCGAPAPVPAAAAPPPPAAAGPPSPSGEALAWQIDVSLLGNRFLRGSLVKGCLLTAAISALVLGGVLGFADGSAATGLTGAAIAAGATFALFGVGTLGFLVLVGVRQPIAYRLDADGAVMLNASRAARGIHRAALIAGVLSGKPSAAAAGATAMAGETRSCAWAGVKAVEDHPADRTLIVRGGPLSTIHVFCTPENYAQVRAFIDARTGHAAKR